MALNVNIFYTHNLTERLNIITRLGEFISRIKYYGFYIDLYIIDESFVEVYYNWHNTKLEKIELLEPNNEKLNLYVAHIDISDLNKP